MASIAWQNASPSFDGAARRFVAATLATSVATLVLAVLAAAGVGAALAPMVGAESLSGGLIVGLLGGGAVGIAVARGLSRRLGRAIARPMDLIVSHLTLGDDDVTAQLHLLGARPARASALQADLALLGERLEMMAAGGAEARHRLQSAEQTASHHNRIKAQTLATMSHELRTPLNAILGYAMLLHEDAAQSGNAAMVADLERIQQAGQQLLALFGNFLDLSAGTPDRSPADRQVIEIPALLRSVIAGVESSTSRALAIDQDIGEGADLIVTDGGKLRQCLHHLLAAAVRLSDAERHSIRVELAVSGPERSIVFSIPLIGSRLSADAIEALVGERAAEPAPTSPALAGIGPGLSIGRRLAQMMGGTLAAVKARSGTQLTLNVPLNPVTPALIADPAERGQAGCEIEPRVNGEKTPIAEATALVIDDNAASVDLMRRWLVRLGYKVMTASDGEQGLAMARQQRPDLIILDVYLPGCSGYEVLAELRGDAATSETPVILVTVDDDRQRALSAGATDHVRKPAAESQIRSILEIFRSPADGRILVIEDDDDAAAIVTRCAEQVGFSVCRAADGLSGVAMIKALRPDAIVLDLALPGLDGFKVMEVLRGDSALSRIPVVVVSAGDISVDDYRRIAGAGYRYFSKGSVSPRELAAQLKEMAA